jgi:hypothetical protein
MAPLIPCRPRQEVNAFRPYPLRIPIQGNQRRADEESAALQRRESVGVDFWPLLQVMGGHRQDQ